jgi:nitroimidazol reductase NimA-like FMN-containing flavoprotein (pyridoxamine 5'-phosphate oxidase superfamily)
MIEMPKIESVRLLEASLIGRLSLVEATGKPYMIPLRYVWFEDSIFLRLAYDGRKQDAIAHCRQVCFEVDEVLPDFSRYASVIIEGTLLDVHAEAEKRPPLVALNDKYARLCRLPSPGPNPVTQGVAIRRIEVLRLAGRKSEPVSEQSAVPRLLPRRGKLRVGMRRMHHV